MELYLIANLVFFLLTGLLLWILVKKMPYMLVKPSFIFLMINYCFIQFPSVFYAPITYSRLETYWDYFILSQIFPLATLAISLLCFNKTALEIWDRLNIQPFRFNGRVGVLYILIGLAIGAGYLMYVGITKTGVYAILFDPTNSTMAREESLKLLNSQMIKYAYALLCSAIAPVAAAMFALQTQVFWKQKKIALAATMAFFVIICFVLISFPGHRWGPLVILLTIFMAFGYQERFKFFKLSQLLFLVVILFSITAIISFKREGVDISQVDIFEYLFGLNDGDDLAKGDGGLFWVVFGRVFVIPMKVGWDYLSYVEKYGYWGVAAIPKLAALFGIESIDVSNLMCMYIYPDSLFRWSGTYPAGFIYSYYSYFGINGALLSLISIVLLDALVLSYRYLKPAILVPVLATVSVAAISLTGCDFTTALISQGILSSVALAFAIQSSSLALINKSKGRNNDCYN